MAQTAAGVGTVYQRDDSECWQWQFTFNGKRYRGSCETTNKRLAMDRLRNRVTEICNGTYVAPNQQKTVDELVEVKLRDDKANGSKSYNTTEGRWRLHLKPFFTGIMAVHVTEALLKEYRDHRLDQDEEGEVSPTTVNREFALLRNSFNQDPRLRGKLKFPMLPEAASRQGFLEDHEYPEFSKACAAEGIWMSGITELGYEYAWRKSEVKNLKVAQVSFETNRISLPDTKNGEPRRVAMTDFIKGILEKCCAGKGKEDWVFTRPSGEHVVDFRDAWDRVAKVIKHPDLIFHDLRRSGARRMLRDGIPEKTVMIIGGWKTLTMLYRYNIISERDTDAAVTTMNLKRKEREVELKNKQEEERKKKEQEESRHVSVTVEQKQGLNAEADKSKLLQATAL